MRNTCKIEGCDRFVVTNGLCDAHRKRLARYNQLESLRPADWGQKEKHPLYRYWMDTRRRETLNICDSWKTDFWSFVSDIKERPSKNHYIRAVDLSAILGPDNWQWVEGLTDANRLILSRQRREKSDRNRAKVSTEERVRLMEAANHQCQICGKKEDIAICPTTGQKMKMNLSVDHCHQTGRLRGILCRNCNSAIGLMKDDIKLFEKAVEYLRN